jgi:hypothetical protein
MLLRVRAEREQPGQRGESSPSGLDGTSNPGLPEHSRVDTGLTLQLIALNGTAEPASRFDCGPVDPLRGGMTAMSAGSLSVST